MNEYVQLPRHRLDEVFQLVRAVIAAEDANLVEDATPHLRKAYALAQGLTHLQHATACGGTCTLERVASCGTFPAGAAPKTPAFELTDHDGYEARFSD